MVRWFIWRPLHTPKTPPPTCAGHVGVQVASPKLQNHTDLRVKTKIIVTDVPIRIFYGIVIRPMPGMSMLCSLFLPTGGLIQVPWNHRLPRPKSWSRAPRIGALLLTEGQRSEEPHNGIFMEPIFAYIISHDGSMGLVFLC